MIKYYKRVKNGKVIDLHVHKEFNDYVESIIYPANKTELYYEFKDFIELENVDEFLDTGIENSIFSLDSEQSV